MEDYFEYEYESAVKDVKVKQGCGFFVVAFALSLALVLLVALWK